MKPLWTRSFFRIGGIHLLLFFAFAMVTPVLPLYLREFTSHEGLIGAVVGVFTLSTVTVRYGLGPVIDRVGRRPILRDGLAWFALASAAYALTQSVISVLAVRILHGIGFAASTTATNSIAADIIPPERRAEGLGYFGSTSGLAHALAPVLGFTVFLRWGGHALFLTGAGMAALALALARTQEETAAAGPGRKPAPPGWAGEAILPSALMGIFALGGGGVFTLIPLYSGELGVSNPGIVFSAIALAVVVVRPLAGGAADRLGPVPVLAVATVVGAAGFLLLGFAARAFAWAGLPGGLLAGAAAFGFALGTILPVCQATAVSRTPRVRWGAASATFASALDLGIGSGAFLLGNLAHWVGIGSMFRWAALLPVLALVLLLARKEEWRVGDSPAGPGGKPKERGEEN